MAAWNLARRTDLRAASLPEYAPGRLPPAPDGILDPAFAWVDVEASSLRRASYPVEIGWSFDDLSGGSFLVKPAHGWIDWDHASEVVHGIKRADAARYGLPAAEAAWRLNRVLAGRTVLSDTVGPDGAGGTDHHWLTRLFVAGRTEMRFGMLPISVALANALDLGDAERAAALAPRLDEARALARSLYPRTHLAGEDAMSMAAEWRLAVDDRFAADVRRFKADRCPPSLSGNTLELLSRP